MPRVFSIVFLLASCAGNSATPPVAEAPVETPEPADPPPAEPPPTPPPTEATPASLYEECKGFVEGQPAEGECEKDEDCKAAGCSGEVCITAAQAAEFNSICMERPCYKILDTCGCHEGQCTWTLKDAIPEEADKPLPTKLPTKMPPHPPPKEGG